MPLNVSHDIEIPAGGLNLDLPAGNYIIHTLSVFGPWMKTGTTGTVDAEDADFFTDEDDLPVRLPSLNEHLPGRSVVVAEGDRIALRTNAGEVGDFKQRKVDPDTNEVTLVSSTWVRIESAVPFDPFPEEVPVE